MHERNPVVVGALGLTVIAAGILAAFRADDLPLVGGGSTYYAAFGESAGLKSNDEVRVAGVRVGKVDEVSLDDGHVRVEFTVDREVILGSETRAAIKIKTLLGAMYLSLDSVGSGELDKGEEIPVERTTSPYEVVEAFTGLADASSEIDTRQLTAALVTLTQLSANTPEEFRDALRGTAALSSKIAARDQQIDVLLTNLRTVSGALGDRDLDIIRLMGDADVLFQALVARRDAVHNLLISTIRLSRELSGLVRRTRTELGPALDGLDAVVSVLLKNQDNLDQSLRLLAPYYRAISNTTGNGPWIDLWMQNLPPVPSLGGDR